jgi:hypothetical protein
MNRDAFGAICQIREDGSIECGDSVCWTGHEYYLSGKNPIRKHSFSDFFGAGKFAYVRHPNDFATDNSFGCYYKNPWDGVISRDQLTGLLAGLIAEKNVWRSFLLIIHHAAWLFLFSYNTRPNGKNPKESKWKWPDPTGPAMWAMEIRALRWWGAPLYPLLCVFDLYNFFAVFYYNKTEDKDPINFCIQIIIGREFFPTPFSFLTFKLLFKEKMILELSNYWCGWRDNCEIVDLYAERILK